MRPRLTVTVTALELDEDECYLAAEAEVFWDGQLVGASSWVYLPWEENHPWNCWHYSGDCRDCWADSDLMAFLDEHDPEETPGEIVEVAPEDIRCLIEPAVRRHEEAAV